MSKKYEVIVVCEEGCAVLNDRPIRWALKGKIKGAVFCDIPTGCSEDIAATSLERSFLLTEKSDVELFKQAIAVIDGVTDIKDGCIWLTNDQTGEITFLDKEDERYGGWF